MASSTPCHTGVTAGYHWGNTDDAEAIRKAIADVNREIDSGAHEVTFVEGKTTIISQQSPPSAPTHSPRWPRWPQRRRSQRNSHERHKNRVQTEHLKQVPKKPDDAPKLSNLFERLKYAQQMQNLRESSMPSTYKKLYPSHQAFRDANIYLTAYQRAGLLEAKLLGNTSMGGGMSVHDTLCNSFSVQILEPHKSLCLTLEYKSVWRSYKVTYNFTIKKRSIEIYTGVIPFTGMTADELSKRAFKKMKKAKYTEIKNVTTVSTKTLTEELLKPSTPPPQPPPPYLPPLSRTTTTVSAVVPITDFRDIAKAETVEEMKKHETKPETKPETTLKETDEKILEELLNNDSSPLPHPSDYLFGRDSPSADSTTAVNGYDITEMGSDGNDIGSLFA